MFRYDRPGVELPHPAPKLPAAFGDDPRRGA
jgi:hypothetical protein